ncbi:restriction endonuclease subunit S [Dongia sp.]|uniref:restriction endonuclease subunit S n=1 Tax=Dongia sp. TaxID=1977262 RepID=UPI0035B36CC3
MQEENLLSLSYGRIIRKDIDAAEGLLPESFETYQIVEPGNIVMRLTDLQNDKRSLRQGLVNERGIITSAYDALEVGKDHDARFWAYSLLALDLAKYYYSLGGGVRQSIKFADFPNDWIASPGPATQEAIADFLDRETTHIDQLIQKKLWLAELLNVTIIAAPLRVMASGIGQVGYDAERSRVTFSNLAEGWRRVRVKQVASHMTSGSRGWSDFIQDQGELFLQSGSIDRHMGVSFEDSQRVRPQSGAEAERTKVSNGDTLVCITGGRTGAVGYVSGLCERAYINQHICLIRPSKAISSRLLAQILFSEIGQLHFQMAQYGLKQGMGFEQVANTAIPLPPREAQDKISSEIDHRAAKTRRVAEEISASIDRLHEFRSALITAAVTGQIDVATWSKRGTTDRRLDAIQREVAS